MNTAVKILVGLVTGMVLLCLVVGGIGLLATRAAGQGDPGRVAAVAGKIAGYDLPPGFGNGYAARVAGFTLVGYTGDDGHSHIYFFQLPSGVRVDPTAIGRQFDRAIGKPGSAGRRTQLVGQLPATVCGQAITLAVSEGFNSDGEVYREVSGVFQGKGGQALVMFERPVSRWDQAEVDTFLASIR